MKNWFLASVLLFCSAASAGEVADLYFKMYGQKPPLSAPPAKATVYPRWSALASLVIVPGMWLQRLTTRQPNDEQLEVACVAMRVLLAKENLPEPAATAAESPQAQVAELIA